MRRILVADDDPLIHLTLGRLFPTRGEFLLVHAYSLDDAQEMTGGDFDIAIIDGMLQDKPDGDKIARLVAERGISFVRFTGEHPDSIQEKGLGVFVKGSLTYEAFVCKVCGFLGL